MKKNLLKLFIIMLFVTQIGYCENSEQDNSSINAINTQKHNKFKQRRMLMNKLIDERLNLTAEQQEQIKNLRIEHRKNVHKIVDKMKNKKEKIATIYKNEKNKIQADIKSAPYKAELIALKNEIIKLRKEHRTKFMNVLTESQKVEFNKIRKEVSKAYSTKTTES